MTDLNNANRKMDRSLTLVTVRFTKLLFVVVVAQSDSGRLPGKSCKETEKSTGCEWMARASRRVIAFLREVGNHTPCVESVRERV